VNSLSVSRMVLSFLLVSCLSVNSWGERKIFFVHSDHLGTPQALTDKDQRVVWRANYTPFGKAEVDEDPDGDGQTVEFNLRFPGLNLYRNGVLEDSKTATGMPVRASTLSALGAGTSGSAAINPAQVRLDQFRLFDTVLNATEIEQIYNEAP